VPEGHTLHRLAIDHRRDFAGKVVSASSPQGRFGDEAARIDERTLEDVEAYGKHLFYDFGGGDVVHVHLGLFGRFFRHEPPPPPPRATVRLRLSSTSATADLVGATECRLIDPLVKEAVLARLGPDPIRKDADPEQAWRKLQRRKTPIGAVLMDQSVLAGVGNVYRAEILFRQRVSPFRLGQDVDADLWARMWADLVKIMKAGVREGRIVTTERADRDRKRGPARLEDAHYVYRRTGLPCRICGTEVRTQEMVGRNLYWCPVCQAV
jgi:endonuclease-8